MSRAIWITSLVLTLSVVALGGVVETARVILRAPRDLVSVLNRLDKVGAAERDRFWSANWDSPDLKEIRGELTLLFRGILNERPTQKNRFYVAKAQAYAARYLAAVDALTQEDKLYLQKLVELPYLRGSPFQGRSISDVLDPKFRELILSALDVARFGNSSFYETLAKQYVLQGDHPTIGTKAAQILLNRASESEESRKEIEKFLSVEDLLQKLRFFREKYSKEIVQLRQEEGRPNPRATLPDLIARRESDIASLAALEQRAKSTFRGECEALDSL